MNGCLYLVNCTRHQFVLHGGGGNAKKKRIPIRAHSPGVWIRCCAWLRLLWMTGTSIRCDRIGLVHSRIAVQARLTAACCSTVKEACQTKPKSWFLVFHSLNYRKKLKIEDPAVSIFAFKLVLLLVIVSALVYQILYIDVFKFHPEDIKDSIKRVRMDMGKLVVSSILQSPGVNAAVYISARRALCSALAADNIDPLRGKSISMVFTQSLATVIKLKNAWGPVHNPSLHRHEQLSC